MCVCVHVIEDRRCNNEGRRREREREREVERTREKPAKAQCLKPPKISQTTNLCIYLSVCRCVRVCLCVMCARKPIGKNLDTQRLRDTHTATQTPRRKRVELEKDGKQKERKQ